MCNAQAEIVTARQGSCILIAHTGPHTGSAKNKVLNNLTKVKLLETFSSGFSRHAVLLAL